MARIIALDAGPLWLAAIAPGKSQADQCRSWIKAVEVGGAQVVIPEIADYEVRRELTLRGATASLRRLNTLKATIDYQPITTPAMMRAAEFWALLRRGGIPTAAASSLDADAILAGQATTMGTPGDVVTIATTNVRHLARFPGVIAKSWESLS